jgi:hypothetical protein
MIKLENTELNLSVSKTFEENFRYLMSEVNNIEWGGVVIYSIKNFLFDKKVKIKLEDFFLLDIGSVVETKHDYAESPEFVTLLMKYPGKSYGLIHSHTHQVYYSGTDEKEIAKNEKYYLNGYLSVVVNSAGDILARLTKKLKVSSTSVIELNGQTKTITSNYQDLFYIQDKININRFKENIWERIQIIEEKKEKIRQSQAKKSKGNKAFLGNYVATEEEIQKMYEEEQFNTKIAETIIP